MELVPKKATFREAFRDFSEEDTTKDLSSLSPNERGLELIKYYVDQIHNRVGKYIGEDDFDYSVTDGKDDLGIVNLL